jgi:origin recognition complex subunit 1
MVAPTKEIAKIKHVQEVMNTMSKSPTAVYLKGCSYHERVMLAALLKCMKREGVEEIRWGDVCVSLFPSLVMHDSDITTSFDSSSLNIFPTTTSSPPP